eukprot:SAG22_NODE_837_length_6911_cov_4.576629_6_plen_327_part_00
MLPLSFCLSQCLRWVILYRRFQAYEMEKVMASRNTAAFLALLPRAFLWQCFMPATNRLTFGYFKARMTWKWRYKMTHLLHAKYFSKMNYYFIGEGGGTGGDKMADADHRMVDDVKISVQAIANTLGNTLWDTCQAFFYSVEVLKRYGVLPALSCMVYPVLSVRSRKALSFYCASAVYLRRCLSVRSVCLSEGLRRRLDDQGPQDLAGARPERRGDPGPLPRDCHPGHAQLRGDRRSVRPAPLALPLSPEEGSRFLSCICLPFLAVPLASQTARAHAALKGVEYEKAIMMGKFDKSLGALLAIHKSGYRYGTLNAFISRFWGQFPSW